VQIYRKEDVEKNMGWYKEKGRIFSVPTGRKQVGIEGKE